MTVNGGCVSLPKGSGSGYAPRLVMGRAGFLLLTGVAITAVLLTSCSPQAASPVANTPASTSTNAPVMPSSTPPASPSATNVSPTATALAPTAAIFSASSLDGPVQIACGPDVAFVNPSDLGILLNLMLDAQNSPGQIYSQLDLQRADDVEGVKWKSSHYPEYGRTIIATDAMKGSPDTKCLLYWRTTDGGVVGGQTAYLLAVNGQVNSSFMFWAGIGGRIDRAHFYIMPPIQPQSTPKPGGGDEGGSDPTPWTPPPTPAGTPIG